MKSKTIYQILERPHNHEWSLQGFGMLRLYISDAVRLHVWDSAFRVPNVSLIHTHPWDFQSEVICGSIRNTRYVEHSYDPIGTPYCSAIIRCGPGGGVRSETLFTNLTMAQDDWYDEGAIYTQHAEEIHLSRPHDGTVTLVTRTFKGDKDHARVFWPRNEQWVSAEPRRATDDEVTAITQKALALCSQ